MRLKPLGEGGPSDCVPTGDKLGDFADPNILRNRIRKDGTYGVGERTLDAP